MEATFFDVEIDYDVDNNLKKEDVKKLIEWTKNQPHLPEINEAQAILFLQRWQYQNEIVKDAVDAYFTFKTYCPGLLLRSYLNSPITQALDVVLITVLPKTPDGTNIIYVRLMDLDVDKFNLAIHMIHLDMVIMSNLYKEGNFNGYMVIVDMTDVPFNVIAKLDPLQIKRILFYLQEIIPLRLKAIHYVNTMSFMTAFLNLVKALVKTDVLLTVNHKIECLTKYFPKDCLPKEYGGAAESITVLHEKSKRNILKNTALFNWEDTQTVDEAKRPADNTILEAVVGTVDFFPQDISSVVEDFTKYVDLTSQILPKLL